MFSDLQPISFGTCKSPEIVIQKYEMKKGRHRSWIAFRLNAAQQLYIKRGYIPDGRGITYQNRPVKEGANVVVDDHLVMHFTKQLPAEK